MKNKNRKLINIAISIVCVAGIVCVLLNKNRDFGSGINLMLFVWWLIDSGEELILLKKEKP